MKLPNGAPSSLKAFIGFGLGFSGRYFASFAPKYANGKKEDFLGEMTHSVQAVQAILQKRCGPPPPTHGGVLGGAPSPPIFRCHDYREVAAVSEDGGSIYLIYCDPPYRTTKFPHKVSPRCQALRRFRQRRVLGNDARLERETHGAH